MSVTLRQPEVDDSLSKDEIFDVLSNRRRRYVIHHLKQSDSPVKLGCLAERVAAWENDTSVEAITSDERKRVYVALHQSHVPKMKSANIVEYNSNGLELTEAASDLDMYLELVPRKEIPWSEYYLGLSSIYAALIIGVWVEAFPFTLIPRIAWAAIIVVTFGVSALVHTFYNRQMRLGNEGAPPEV